MATATAAVLEGVERLALREFPLPTIGPDDALLRVEMVGVCGTDYHVFDGTLAAPLPLILGHEILGRIAAIGERAATRYGVRAGDRVTVEGSVPCWACEACLTGSYRFCASKRGYGLRMPITEPPALWGAMAEYMYLAPGSVVHRVPESISAAVAIVGGIVANGIQWLRRHGDVSVGDTVVIQGAGPQGLAATMVARESGAAQVIVTGLARDAGRLALARELGADHTLVADQEDVVARVHSLTGGRLADVVLDVTGSPQAIQASVQLVRRQGTLVLGGLTGKATITGLPLDHLVWNEIRLQGVYTKGADAIAAAHHFLATRGHRYPLERMVSHVYPLAEAEQAIRAAGGAAGDQFIKAAITP
ncbi:MAG: alcohol dehydrogenase catalytic domain-containing protein [Chloroflexi bacterium]|nr:alcohol dehydrogenase catalytic domain-containing protein [Chloroflexota bacterium]